MNRFEYKLRQLELAGRYRSLQLPFGIDLTSNDYLGLSNHPKLREAAIKEIESGMPLGSGGSRLLRGHTRYHAEIEDYGARFFGFEKALYFTCGYLANMGIFCTLPDRNDAVIYDALIHASVREGIHASHAKMKIKARHSDLEDYEDAISRARDEVKGKIWLAVESVYSMDGDLAPLQDIHALCRAHDVILIVDEAHATGVFGTDGRGLTEKLPRDNLIVLHGFGKAMGVAGSLVCAAEDIIDYLINTARTIIYTTAPMPLQPFLARCALDIVRDEPERREKLFSLRDLANRLLPVPPSPSQIIPVVIGDDQRTTKIAAALQEAGYDVRAIRPPTVPEGTARLRISLSSDLDEAVLRDFARILAPLIQKRAA